jgi:hypothetical protein
MYMASPNKTEKSHENDTRIALLEHSVAHIDQTLVEIKQALIALDRKIDTKIDSVNNRIWTIFIFMISGFAAILAVMAHGFHWV